MLYGDFKTIPQGKEKFGLTRQEGVRFFPELTPIAPSPMLSAFLEQSLPIAIATGSEKAGLELIITPVLLEVRHILHQQLGLFFGEAFDVDASLGFNGIFDFIFSKSPTLLKIEAPVAVIIEAKGAALKTGMGQCIAAMLVSQLFNQGKQQPQCTI